jgi:HSP20 family protein
LSEQFLNIARARWWRFAVYAMLGELAVLCPVITGFFMPAENNGAGGQRPRTHAPARKENNMAIRDLIPWNKNQLPTTGDVYDPFVTFHREMNRLFDDVFRGFGNFGSLGRPMMEGQFSWPRIELDETDKAVTVSAELPGLSEKDVQVEIANGVLSIRGEKKSERDNGGRYSERYYGSFERRIPLDGVQEDKAEANFRNGVLTVSLPKTEQASQNVKRITINTN